MEMELGLVPFVNFNSAPALERYNQTQGDIVEKIVELNKKVIVVNAPTGTGKSLLGMMAGYRTGHKVNYVCSSKPLQDQLAHDFPEAEKIKGRANYWCNLYLGFHSKKPYMKADSCMQKCEEYKASEIACEYYDQKKKVLMAKYRILNTYYYLYEANYSGAFSKQHIVIIDEADTLDDILTGFIELFVSEAQIRKYGLELPDKVTKYESWVEWAEGAYNKLIEQYDPSVASHGLDREYIKGVMFVRKLELFIDLVDKTWLFDRNDKGWSFKPLWLSPEITKQYLFRHADKFILMSATLPHKPVLCHTLGLDPSDVEYIEVDSIYPIENRYIHYNPIIEMNYKNKHLEYMVIDEIERLLERHRDVKGIIHVPSYALAEKIMSLGSERLVTHNTDDKDEVIEMFKGSSSPLVLVSPSFSRGISLDDDMGRFVVWPKVPFLNLKDKKVSNRCYSGSQGAKWYSSEAAQLIVQGAGRCVRHKDDYAVTYILDKNFSRVIKYLPKWFREAIVFD